MTTRDREAGSALIVVAVLLIFAGFVLILGLGPFHTTDNQDKIQRTAKRQQLLISELSAYAQRENQLPCPADPSKNPLTDSSFGFSRNANFATNPADPGNCVGSSVGIIPFHTLGLSQYDALDGWGHPFTYAISPALNNASSVANPSIFMSCRRFPWFNNYSGNAADTTAYNVNPGKALFCCPPAGYGGQDIVVTSTQGGQPINLFARTTDGNYDLLNHITTNKFQELPNAGTETQEFFALVIVSHGANGAGSFVLGTNGRLPGVIAGSDEAINAGGTQNFIDHQMILAPGKNYFDDMVVWRTQIGIMGQLNNGSCYAPFN